MTNLSREFCLKAREARRNAGLSQSLLAQRVGCKQSALSMFEQGDGTKLNDEVVKKIAELFQLEIPKEGGAPEGPGVSVRADSPAPRHVERGFCPNPACTSNHRYWISGREFARPDREAADPVGAKFCAVCGEILEKKCPNCGAPLHEGAVCSFCGQPYIAIA